MTTFLFRIIEFLSKEEVVTNVHLEKGTHNSSVKISLITRLSIHHGLPSHWYHLFEPLFPGVLV